MSQENVRKKSLKLLKKYTKDTPRHEIDALIKKVTKPKAYWLWFWGVNQNDLQKRSPQKKFKDFDKMKTYSAKHSHKHKWIGKDYWSNYKKID